MDQGEQIIYGEKLYEVAKGIVIGFAGNRGAFEVFRTQLAVSMNQRQSIGTYDNDELLLLISETMSKITTKLRPYEEDFEALVAISNPSGKADLKRFYPDGKFVPIDTVATIGVGARYGHLFLSKCWTNFTTMYGAAELGYFTIKCIEKLALTNTVGLASDFSGIVTHYPQTWFIPDKSNEIYQLADRPEMMKKIEQNVTEKFSKLNKFLEKLFPMDIPANLQDLAAQGQEPLFVPIPEPDSSPNSDESC